MKTRFAGLLAGKKNLRATDTAVVYVPDYRRDPRATRRRTRRAEAPKFHPTPNLADRATIEALAGDPRYRTWALEDGRVAYVPAQFVLANTWGPTTGRVVVASGYDPEHHETVSVVVARANETVPGPAPVLYDDVTASRTHRHSDTLDVVDVLAAATGRVRRTTTV